MVEVIRRGVETIGQVRAHSHEGLTQLRSTSMLASTVGSALLRPPCPTQRYPASTRARSWPRPLGCDRICAMYTRLFLRGAVLARACRSHDLGVARWSVAADARLARRSPWSARAALLVHRAHRRCASRSRLGFFALEKLVDLRAIDAELLEQVDPRLLPASVRPSRCSPTHQRLASSRLVATQSRSSMSRIVLITIAIK